MEILVHKQRRRKLALPNTIAEANSYHIKCRGNNDTEKTSQGRENKPRRGTTSFRSQSQMLTMKAVGKINRCFFKAIEAVHGFCIFHSLRCCLPPTVRELRKSAKNTQGGGGCVPILWTQLALFCWSTTVSGTVSATSFSQAPRNWKRDGHEATRKKTKEYSSKKKEEDKGKGFWNSKNLIICK